MQGTFNRRKTLGSLPAKGAVPRFPVKAMLQPAVSLAVPILLVWFGAGGVCHAERERPPSFGKIAAFTRRHFEALPSYEPGNIISQGQVEPLLDSLRKFGWVVPGQKALLREVAGDQDFVVRQLRTKRGGAFMEKVRVYPLAYDRLYRLASLPGGRRTVFDLIRGKDGYKLIKYLTTSEGGEHLGKMLGNTPQGANFNKPIGKIFTVDSLIARLKKSYQAEGKVQAN